MFHCFLDPMEGKQYFSLFFWTSTLTSSCTSINKEAAFSPENAALSAYRTYMTYRTYTFKPSAHDTAYHSAASGI